MCSRAARPELQSRSPTSSGPSPTWRGWPTPCSTRSLHWTQPGERCSQAFAISRCLRIPSGGCGGPQISSREHRGDGHLAACISAGLNMVEMNVLTELWIGYPPGEYSSTRRHSSESIELALHAFIERGWWDGHALTAEGHSARNAIEGATDASQQQLVERLGSDINRLIDTAAEMAETVVAVGAFTDDRRKRAAG